MFQIDCLRIARRGAAPCQRRERDVTLFLPDPGAAGPAAPLRGGGAGGGLRGAFSVTQTLRGPAPQSRGLCTGVWLPSHGPSLLPHLILKTNR